MTPTDPFEALAPNAPRARRMAFAAYARATTLWSRHFYTTYALPEIRLADAPPPPEDVPWNETGVTPEQMRHLLWALSDTERVGGCVVEIGSYRGATLRCLARRTPRRVVAIDPFLGDFGSSEDDYRRFEAQVADLPNVSHVRATSGAAAAAWSHGPIGFVFVDAVHDYVNTAFDIAAWWPKLSMGGVMALHDCDERRFAGTRRAIFLHRSRRDVGDVAHVTKLTILRKTR